MTMTDERMALLELVEQQDGGDLVSGATLLTTGEMLAPLADIAIKLKIFGGTP